MSIPAPQARSTLEDAFGRFKDTITVQDARSFDSATLLDVRNAARDIEEQLAKRSSARNMRKLLHVFAGLERYSKAVDILCNGTPYLPYIWAPITLMLQLASEYVEAFDKLIAAYKQIAENLPRFDRLSTAFKDTHEFQQVLAIIYADILEFHRRAYKLFRRRGWKFFFKSSWGGFDRRFKGILEDLARHSDLIDREANAMAISEAKEFRGQWLEKISKQEDERLTLQSKNVLTWLEATSSEQEDELDRLISHRQSESCSWIFQNLKIKQWLRNSQDCSVLWLKGKPGSGKSVLCSAIAEKLQQDKPTVLLYYFCSYLASSANNCAKILRSLAVQILRHDLDLCAIVYDEFVSQNLPPSVVHLRKLLPKLLESMQSVRIIVDGLDEFEDKDYKFILTELGSLAMCNAPEGTCKILISSQDVFKIARTLQRRSNIDLNEEREAINGAIQVFVQSSVSDLHLNLDAMSGTADAIPAIEQALVAKADGMFLWVQLVLTTLENVFSILDMQKAVDTLPEGLDKVYDRIFTRMRRQLDTERFAMVIRIFQWIACSKRAVKKFEVQDGITLHPSNTLINEDTRPSRGVFDLCKPLIEDGPNDTLRLVHTSVKEYLLGPKAPLFHYATAHNDIAFSCAAYLVSSFNLVDPHYSEQQRMVDIGRGCHGLLRYADDFWTEHLLTYLDTSPGATRTDEWGLLFAQLATLCKRHHQAVGPIDMKPLHQSQTLLSKKVDSRLVYIREYEEIYCVVVAEIRGKHRQEGEKSITSGTLTTFGRILQEYDRIVQHLLVADAVPGLRFDSLAAFRSTYGSSAYVCRSVGCYRALSGFESQREWLDHEATHMLNLVCPESSCEYNKLGFSNPKTLKRHVEEYHPLPDAAERLQTIQWSSTGPETSGLNLSESSDQDAEELPEVVDELDVPTELCGRPETSLLGILKNFEHRDDFALGTTAWE